MEPTDPIEAALALRKSDTLASLIMRKLEARILKGEIKAGERLNEVTLAAEFGVSRGPIREAARLLERNNLVEVVVNRGSFVRRIDEEQLLELYDLRGALTWLACGEAAANRDPDSVAKLQTLTGEMERAAEAENAADYYELNLEFHETLMTMASNERLAIAYDALVKEAHLFRQQSLTQRTEMDASNAEHRAIVTAIEAGDVDRARAAGFDHVMHGKARFLETGRPAPPHE